MGYSDAVSRIGQIEDNLAALRTAFDPSAAATPSQSVATTAPATASTSFATALAQAQSPLQSTLVGTSAGLSQKAVSMLTTGQQQFATRLAADTGLDPQVIAAWLLAEESGGAAQSRQSANNNDWLNIGYTDSGTYGSSDAIWSNPIAAADATAGWLRGQDTIPGYGRAAAGIQAILQTAGQSPSAQIAAIQNSGWASGGYGILPTLLAQVSG